MTARDRIGREIQGLYDRVAGSSMPDRPADALLVGIEAVQRCICAVLGHHPEVDNCGNPEHDYCVWCTARTPGAAHL